MCFSMDLIKQLLILGVVIAVVFGLLKLIVPFVVAKMGITLGAGYNLIVNMFRLVFWGFVAIICIVVCFELIACVISWSGGISLPRH